MTEKISEKTEIPSGFTEMAVYGYHDSELSYKKMLVPTSVRQHVEALNAQVHAWREMDREAALALENQCLGLSQRMPEEDLKALKGTSTEPDPELADGVDVLDTEDAKDKVRCVNRDDVLAQKKAAESNSKFQERDRTNAIKATTKALLARPMTRRIGRPKNIEDAMKRLAEIAPHIPELVDAVRVPLLVSAATGAPPIMAPILLVGAPGVGKSHVAMGLAEILGVPVHTVSYAAGGNAGNSLSGADKAWGNATTGAVFDLLAMGEYANPVICLDELDKCGTSISSNDVKRHPANELLTLLEPLTAKDHRDRCADIRVDARHIVWVATANSLSNITAPLLSRFKLILVGKPDARAAVTIALSVAASVCKDMGVGFKPPRGEALQFLATLPPRVMRQIWTSACGWAVSHGHDAVTMTEVQAALGYQTGVQNLCH